jgi:hypothetical protein
MAVAALALMLVALGAAGGVARSDPAPPTHLTLKATPDKIVMGSATELRGKLSHKNGDSVYGKRILLEQKVAGTSVWVPVPSVPAAGLLTNAGGEFSLAGVKPQNNTQYRVRFVQGSNDYTSDAVPVGVKVKVPIALSKNHIMRGNSVKVSGFVLPGQGTGQLIRLTFQGNHKMVSKFVPLDGSAFSYEFSPQKTGKYIVTARYRLTDRTSNFGNKSVSRTLRVR